MFICVTSTESSEPTIGSTLDTFGISYNGLLYEKYKFSVVVSNGNSNICKPLILSRFTGTYKGSTAAGFNAGFNAATDDPLGDEDVDEEDDGENRTPLPILAGSVFAL